MFLSGLAHVTIPNATGPESETWIQSGKYGLGLAMDTADVSDIGHLTTYPSAADCVTVSFVLSPENAERIRRVRKVLYEGGCRMNEMIGI